MQPARPAPQLVFKVGRGHGNAALHLFQAHAGILGQVERAIEQQIVAVGDRGGQRQPLRLAASTASIESMAPSAARLEGSTAPGS